MDKVLLEYVLIKTKQRLTFDIISQSDEARYFGEDEGDYHFFRASNRYEVISRSRMDIQTERIWLLGGQPHERSGTMVFSSDEKRDKAYLNFKFALNEWALTQGGVALDKTKEYLQSHNDC